MLLKAWNCMFVKRGYMGIEETFITRGREQRHLTSHQPTKYFSGWDTERNSSIAGPMKVGTGNPFTGGATREPRGSHEGAAHL